MRELFEKLYYLEEFVGEISANKIHYIGSKSLEPRADNKVIIDALSKVCECNEMFLDYDYSLDELEYKGEKYNLKTQANLIFKEINKEEAIILNMTALSVRVLGTLLFNIKKLGFLKVYCLYTEPLRYCKKNINDEEDIDKFDLYKRFRGPEAIPGYLRENNDSLDEKWVVFLGFEGKRSIQIYDQYEFENIVPVVTLPSYQPGWHNYVFDQNLELIKKSECKVEYIIANSFMSSYDYLETLIESNPSMYYRVSPLGTKINTLGALLFSLNHTERMEILYDNPIENGRVSEDCGKTLIFDISEVINK